MVNANANASDANPTANSLNYRDPTSSGLSQYSHNSRRSHVSSLHSQHTPNIVIDELRMQPNITASLMFSPPTLNAPSLLNTFANSHHNNSQSQNQTPRSGNGSGSGNEIGGGGISDNINVIINVDPGNDVYNPDDDNGAM